MIDDCLKMTLILADVCSFQKCNVTVVSHHKAFTNCIAWYWALIIDNKLITLETATIYINLVSCEITAHTVFHNS